MKARAIKKLSINCNHSLYFKGLSWFILSLIISATNDLITKALSDLPFWEISFFRFSFSMLFLLPFIAYFGKTSIMTNRFGVHLTRGLLLFLAINIWNYGISLVPVTVVTIMSFTTPIFVLTLAPLFLKEKVTIELWFPTVICFFTIFVVLIPSKDFFAIESLVFICACSIFAILDILNKKYVVKESMLSMIFYSSLVTTILSIYPTFAFWLMPSLQDIFLLMILGICNSLILFCLLKAFRLTSATSLVPFRYIELLITAIASYLLFAEIPTINTYIGGSIIILCTFYISLNQTNRNSKNAEENKT